MVRPASAEAAVAAAAGRAGRSLFRLAVGNHAAADRRQDRRAVLQEIFGALARCRRARPRLARRRAAAFVVTRGDELLVRTRPEKGLLGGMTEVPTSGWLAAQDDKTALQQAPMLKGIARWHRKAGVVTHVFTHFPLELAVYTANVPTRARAPHGMRWVPISTLGDEALPNVMRKVIAHGLGKKPPHAT